MSNAKIRKNTNYLFILGNFSDISDGTFGGGRRALVLLQSWIFDGIESNLSQNGFAQIYPTHVREPDKVKQDIWKLFTKMNFLLFFPIWKSFWNLTFPLEYLWQLSNLSHLQNEHKSNNTQILKQPEDN